MSSIPSSAMPHARVHHDVDKKPDTAKPDAANVEDDTLTRIVDTVKAHPRTGIAVGASLVLGAIAAVAIPAAVKANAAPKKPAPKKRAPKKPAAKKTA